MSSSLCRVFPDRMHERKTDTAGVLVWKFQAEEPGHRFIGLSGCYARRYSVVAYCACDVYRSCAGRLLRIGSRAHNPDGISLHRKTSTA